nr:MAG TPA: hypothetical protein [Bacteriophage sp.]
MHLFHIKSGIPVFSGIPILTCAFRSLCDGERASGRVFRGFVVRVNVCRGARHLDNITLRKAVALDMQARLIVHEGIHVQIERRTGGFAIGGVRGRNLISRGVRRNLDGGARRRDGGGELRRELKHIARRNGIGRRGQREARHGLRDNLDGSTGIGSEQRARRERRHAIDAPVIQIHCVGECLRVVELGSAIKSVAHLIPVSRHKQCHRARNAKTRHLNNTIRHVGLIQLKHRRQAINIKRCEIFRLDKQHHLLRVSIRRNIVYIKSIILCARETHTPRSRTQRLKQRLGRRFIGRCRIKMNLIKTKILLVVTNQRQHDIHFIVIIRITGSFHNLRDETVQAEVVHERLTQFVVSPRNWILVFTIHFVEPHGGFGTVHLEQVFGIVLVSMRLNPLDGNFLNGRTPVEIFLFKYRKHVFKRFVLRHHGKANSVNHAPNAIIQILAVHGVEQISRGVRYARLRGARHALLVIVGALKAHLIQNSRIVYSHNKNLLFVYSERVIKVFKIVRGGFGYCFRRIVFTDGRTVFHHLRDGISELVINAINTFINSADTFESVVEFVGYRREHVPKVIELARTVRFVGGEVVAFGGVPFLGGFIVHYHSFHMKKSRTGTMYAGTAQY